MSRTRNTIDKQSHNNIIINKEKEGQEEAR